MKMDERRAYRVLGLPRGASDEEVHAAYRDLAQVWHPDRFSHNERLKAKADRNFARINEAYQVLQDREPSATPSPTPTAERSDWIHHFGWHRGGRDDAAAPVVTGGMW